MSQQELLRKVVQALEDAVIDYMITGSMASSLQGEPRLTHDIDLVVDIRRSAADRLVAAFPSSYFCLAKNSILEAIDNGGMFNLIESRAGDKVDFWTLTDEPFDRSRFRRKYVEEFMGLRLQVSSPEDTILAKLKWAEESGGSEKQFGDALRVYEVQFKNLDTDYLELWASKLELDATWQRLKGEAEIV